MNDKSVSSFLTGRRRYRIEGCWKDHDEVLVLQVEKSVWRDHRWVCEWVDATPDDITKDETI